MATYSTTPIEVEEEKDPLEGVGTLAQQADRKEKKEGKRKTKLQIASEKICNRGPGYRTVREAISGYGKTVSDAL